MMRTAFSRFMHFVEAYPRFLWLETITRKQLLVMKIVFCVCAGVCVCFKFSYSPRSQQQADDILREGILFARSLLLLNSLSARPAFIVNFTEGLLEIWSFEVKQTSSPNFQAWQASLHHTSKGTCIPAAKVSIKGYWNSQCVIRLAIVATPEALGHLLQQVRAHRYSVAFRNQQSRVLDRYLSMPVSSWMKFACGIMRPSFLSINCTGRNKLQISSLLRRWRQHGRHAKYSSCFF